MEQILLESVDQAVDAIKSHARVRPVGAGTKSALHRACKDHTLLDCRGLQGLLEYEPTEFTFTARSGTPIKLIQHELNANSQFLPFDPPFVDQGATLGGAIAAGINGSSSLRYGGARDFVLGIRFVDGKGNHAAAGGKVVKNAAGFDLPKFMVGSYGYFGLLTELTLKVFPRPELQETLIFESEFSDLTRLVKKLILTPLEIDAIDLDPNHLIIRHGGSSDTISSARNRIQEMFDIPISTQMAEDQETDYWASMNQFGWHDDQTDVLLKIPCQINDLNLLVQIASDAGAKFRVSVGGQVVYYAVKPDSVDSVRQALRNSKLNCVAIRGPAMNAPMPRGGLWGAVTKALDPDGRFGGDKSSF